MFDQLTNTFVHYVHSIIKVGQLQHLDLHHVELKGPGEDLIESTTKLLNSLRGKCTSLKSLIIIEDYLAKSEKHFKYTLILILSTGNAASAMSGSNLISILFTAVMPSQL